MNPRRCIGFAPELFTDCWNRLAVHFGLIKQRLWGQWWVFRSGLVQVMHHNTSGCFRWSCQATWHSKDSNSDPRNLSIRCLDSLMSVQMVVLHLVCAKLSFRIHNPSNLPYSSSSGVPWTSTKQLSMHDVEPPLTAQMDAFEEACCITCEEMWHHIFYSDFVSLGDVAVEIMVISWITI